MAKLQPRHFVPGYYRAVLPGQNTRDRQGFTDHSLLRVGNLGHDRPGNAFSLASDGASPDRDTVREVAGQAHGQW